MTVDSGPEDALSWETWYVEWLRTHRGVEITDRTQTHYETAATMIHEQFCQSGFWKEYTANLATYHDEYMTRNGYDLLLHRQQVPVVEKKPWLSFLNKTYRENYLHNGNWPEEPRGGWIEPSNWLAKIPDVARTTIVVKYLDGVEFLATKTRALCEDEHGMEFKCEYEAKPEGYYAAHMYATSTFDVPSMTFDSVKVETKVEIQITTQIQDVIKKLLHKYYEEKRSSLPLAEERAWQWDYTSEQFVVNYLGHILHYVEGMIMEIRDRQRTIDTA